MSGDAVIIVAGGEGKRMGHPVPKQFLILDRRPVLWHALTAFHRYDPDLTIILVLHKDWIPKWKEISASLHPDIRYHITAGGRTRFHSVKNGLARIEKADLVAVHDASRPLITTSLIDHAFKTARRKGNAVPAIPATDSLRIITPDGNKPLDRSTVRYIQTPQIFRMDILKKAFRQTYRPEFTDEATVVETLGESIHLTEGERRNIKITTEMDLKIAKTLLYSDDQ